MNESSSHWEPKRRKLETNESCSVDLWYPNIDPDRGPLPRIKIGLMHVRAADDITVEFDGERNGWVIRMDRTREHEGGVGETIEEKVEVAFVPAWLTEKGSK